MSTLTTYLAEVSAREKAATLGPWENRDYRVHQGPKPIIDAGVEGDLDFIAAARADVPTLLAMVQAVVDVHYQSTSQWFDEDGKPLTEPIGLACAECHKSYPCPTIQALTTAKEAGR